MKGYKPHTVKLQAGVASRVSATGKYFRIFQSTGNLVFFVDGERGDFIQQGIGVSVGDGFKELEFISTTAQTIIVGISDERIDDGRLSLDAPVQIDGGEPTNSYFAHPTVIGSAIEIIAPAVNTNGLAIYNASLSGQAAIWRIFARATAPVGALIEDQMLNAGQTIMTGWGGGMSSQATYPFNVPAGLGVYAACSSPDASYVGLEYRVK